MNSRFTTKVIREENQVPKEIPTGRFRGAVTFLLIAYLFIGCAGGDTVVKPDERILRIGVSTNYPPLIYKQGEDVVGVEADLARAFAAYLGREPVFVEVAWKDQIDKLNGNETDIIMAGMSVTKARLYEIAFSKAYFKTGQMVLVGGKPEFKYLTNYPALIAQVIAMKVGVIRGTTGETYVMENLNTAGAVVRYDKSADAVQALKENKIDMLVYDGVAVLMLEATNRSAGFKKIPLFLTEEYLAWGLRKNDAALLQSANDFRDEITHNGELKKILSKWIPNISDLN